MRKPHRYRVGVDTGGTFTDVVSFDGRELRVDKLPSTPRAPDDAVVEGVRRSAEPTRGMEVVHGSTVGLNAILSRRTARTAFVTSEGFRDLLELGRQDRPDIYDLFVERTAPLVPRELRFTLDCRAFPEGKASLPGKGAVRELVRRLVSAGADAVAVGFLHSYLDPRIERRVARAIEAAGIPATCSADLLPEHREYERFSTAVVNAALVPVMGRYLGRLERRLAPASVLLMQSGGGLVTADRARREPARVLFSGPAGGVAGVRLVRVALGSPRVLAFDMGGTSTDVSLFTEAPVLTRRAAVDGLPVALPAVEVHSIGCGGGSIAHVDAGGALRVGPRSAGADPGPACYGRGDEPTVTDAHVALGRIAPGRFLGGTFEIDPDRAVRAIEQLARQLSLGTRRAAEGILEVADATMERALKVMSVQRGEEPAGLVLVSFGGAGGMHAVRLARRLDIARVVVPPMPGALSALGLALAGPVVERSRPVFRRLGEWPLAERAALACELGEEAAARLLADGIGAGRLSLRIEVDLRYEGQSFEIACALVPGLARKFHALHAKTFGFADAETPVEAVQLRARAARELRGGERWLGRISRRATGGSALPPGRYPRIPREELKEGARIRGPAILEEFSATTFLEEGSIAEVLADQLLAVTTGTG